MKIKLRYVFGVLFTLSLAINVLVSAGAASALSGSQFQAGRIIDDGVFFNRSAMNVQQIQAFLNAKVPQCDTWGTQIYSGSQTRAQYGASKGYPAPYTCVKDYTQATQAIAANAYCGSLGAATKTASQIIYDVAQACGVSPKVLLVLLQKEQSLVTDTWPWSIQYRSATGYGCPDTAPCDAEFYGYFNQVYNAAKQFRRYATQPDSFNYKAQSTGFIQWSPDASCGGSNVFIYNAATAGLYNYTPYQPNTAALNNLYGLGDACSAYGNRNFWRMFNDWFGSTFIDISYVQEQGSAAQYVIYDGKKQLMTYDGLLAWGIYRLPLQTMTTAELNSLPTAATPLSRYATVNGTSSKVFADNSTYYDINDGTVSTWGGFKGTAMSYVGWPVLQFSNFGGALPFIVNITNSPNQYIMEEGTLLPISSPTVLRAWGGTASITLSSVFSSGIPTGGSVMHNLVTVNGVKYFLSGTNVFKVEGALSNIFSSWNPVTISSASLGRYTPSGNLSHLIKSDSSTVIYALDKAQKRPISSFDVFNGLRGINSYETRISNDAMAILPVGTAFNSAILNTEGTSNYAVSYHALYSIPTRLLGEYGAPSRATTVSPDFISIFQNAGQASQFIKSAWSPLVYFVSQGQKIPIDRYDVMVALGGQNSLTYLSDLDLNSLPTATSSMTPILKGASSNVVVIDSNRVFSSTATDPTLSAWNASSKITTVSDATYAAFLSNGPVNTLSQKVQTENGEFCLVDTTRWCAEQFYMIYNWNLLQGVIHPTNNIVSYLNISRAGKVSMFVNGKPGQTYANNVFAMIDGSLYYIPTPTVLANLGFNGYMTSLTDTTINAMKSSSIMNKYILIDPTNTNWVIDGGRKRLVPPAYNANWVATGSNLAVSSSYISLLPTAEPLTRSVTSPATGTVYGMDNGQKRGITTYQKYLQSWSPYSLISPSLTLLIPDGPIF